MDYLKKSRIEEVLIAILGKGVVTSRLISRIEKILDAIRTDGSYDGPVMSEVEEILVCILNGEPFEKPTHSRIAAMLKVKANGGEYTELRKSRVEELIFEWINAVESATYTGTLPATLKTVEGYLESYKIYGNASGVGVETENLFDAATAYGSMYDSATGVLVGDASTLTSMRNKFDSSMVGVPITISVHADDVPVTRVYIRCTIGGTNIDSNAIASNKTGTMKVTVTPTSVNDDWRITFGTGSGNLTLSDIMLNTGSTHLPYEPYGYKLPIFSNSTVTNIYICNNPLAKDEYADSTTGKIYRRTKNLSPPEEEWIDEWIWGDGTVHPSTEIKTSPFIDVSTCETCIMEVFSAETEWAAAGYRAMAFYDENKQYLGWIGGGGRRTLTPNSSERLSEFPAGTVYVRIGCSHSDQPFYPQLVSGYTPTHRFYPYLVPTDPPVPFPQIPTVAGTTTIDYNGEPKPDKVELTYSKPK